MATSEYRLVVREDPKSPVSESIRALRTNLQFVGLDKPLQTLMITSAGPAEGKTTIAANLAISMAETGLNVIVVGADLRRPSLHKVFGVENSVGLTQVLVGQAPLAEAIQTLDTPRVRLLTPGPIPPNPSELLGSQAMVEVIRELKSQADLVIFDAAPVVAVTDASILGPKVDGTVLVVSLKQTPREVVMEAKKQLVRVRTNLLGVVANRVRYGRASGYYYYYDESQSTTPNSSGNGSHRGRLIPWRKSRQ